MACRAMKTTVSVLLAFLSVSIDGSSSSPNTQHYHQYPDNHTTTPPDQLLAGDEHIKSPELPVVDQQVRSQRNARKEWSFKHTLHQIEARLGRVPTGSVSETTVTDEQYHQMIDSAKVRQTRYEDEDEDGVQLQMSKLRNSARAGPSGGVRRGVRKHTSVVGRRETGSPSASSASDEIILDAVTGLANESNLNEVQFRLDALLDKPNVNVIGSSMFVLVRFPKLVDGSMSHRSKFFPQRRSTLLRNDSSSSSRQLSITVYHLLPSAMHSEQRVNGKQSGMRGRTPMQEIQLAYAIVHHVARPNVLLELLLPTTEIQELLDLRQPLLRLRVACQAPAQCHRTRRRRMRKQHHNVVNSNKDRAPYLRITYKSRPATVAPSLTTSSVSRSRVRGQSLRRRVP